MAYKLTINGKTLALNFNVTYQNMAKTEKPEVIAKNKAGEIVKERTVYQGQILPPGSTQRQWTNDQGMAFPKNELTFWYNNEQVQENSQTKIFEIEGYQAIKNYTVSYVIGSYYELSPHDNDMKKDNDKAIAISINSQGMRKLWEYLNANQVVARGEFCVASKGFLASDGYIRAINFGDKWGLEIGVFKEEKIFEHLLDGIPQPVQAPLTPIKKIRMI